MSHFRGFLHRESRKGKEALKKSPPHSTLVASSCVESQGPVGRLTERSEGSEAQRAESERSERRRKTQGLKHWHLVSWLRRTYLGQL